MSTSCIKYKKFLTDKNVKWITICCTACIFLHLFDIGKLTSGHFRDQFGQVFHSTSYPVCKHFCLHLPGRSYSPKWCRHINITEHIYARYLWFLTTFRSGFHRCFVQYIVSGHQVGKDCPTVVSLPKGVCRYYVGGTQRDQKYGSTCAISRVWICRPGKLVRLKSQWFLDMSCLK